MMNMMKKYSGGEEVAKGVYLNLSTFELIQLYGKTLTLPGDGEARYVKVPAPLVVVFGPIAGLVFAIFLPTVGIVGAVSFLGYKLGQWAHALSRALSKHGATEEK